jgi:hypothetical protein
MNMESPTTETKFELMIEIYEKCGISDNEEGNTSYSALAVDLLKVYQMKFLPKCIDKVFVAHRSSVENCYRFTLQVFF